MLAEARHPAGPPAPAFVLDHHRMLSVPRSPRSPRTPRSPRLGLASPKTGGGTSSSRPSTLAAAAPVRPVFDFVRTAGGRPLSLPYSVDHAGHHAGLLARPSPPPSLLDSLSLTEDAEHGDQDNSPAASLLDSPRLTPVSSLMDSNSLARVARLRQPALLDGYQALPAIKRGVLWQQRERLWSRWKERYFVLTSDYLHCFKRRAAGDGLSQMGHFIFKIRLVDLDAVEWVNRRSYSVVALATRDRPRVLLRAAHGLEDWFELLEECTLASKQRRRALYERHPAQFDWNGSLQREGSLSMSPGVEVLLRRRLEEQDHHQHHHHLHLQQQQQQTGRERDDEDQWKPSLLFQREQQVLAEEPSPPPSAPATFRSPPRAARAGPPPSAPPPAAPAAYQPPPGLAGLAVGSARRPVYHRLNPDVFFMAADRPVSDNLTSHLSWRSNRHTQV